MSDQQAVEARMESAELMERVQKLGDQLVKQNGRFGLGHVLALTVLSHAWFYSGNRAAVDKAEAEILRSLKKWRKIELGERRINRIKRLLGQSDQGLVTKARRRRRRKRV